MLVAYSILREMCVGILQGNGVPAGHAELQADLLCEAELAGRASHGVQRLKRIVDRIRNGVTKPRAPGRHEWKGDALLQVDGQSGLGVVVAINALEADLDRAKKTGAVIVVITNNNHLGMLAWYAERVAKLNCCIVAMSTSEALVHPWGGRIAMLGTNPIAVGVPTATGPFVVDLATSKISMGEIQAFANRKAKLPLGLAIDSSGEPTTDPIAAKDGAISPFREAKGYVLGLAFEVLVSALTGAAIGRDKVGTLDSDKICNKGDIFVVPHPAADTAARITRYLDDVVRSPTIKGFSQVRVPGERAKRQKERSLAGGLAIPLAVWTDLENLQRQARLPSISEGI